ncbi:hypothetical protein K7472_04740 [Streptomyces sp. PTM05]|uniref:Uncharacterized protein n=1 Tax=Streptantibioticus parmotrematis TaxID=2873249 RepID=A0ABS7QLT9_9ACTN|nr:hypothetical protein [Streptantibioticus parmotrematis]MBY8884153.1 hypothetical protein [Streptantibioticus parmotrematis]
MNGTYRCEVVAEGQVFGTGETRTYLLAAWDTISPKLALRWLTAQAERLAERLDPDPARAPWTRPAHTPHADGLTALRQAEQPAQRELLKYGTPLTLVIRDTDCRWTLSVRPVRHSPPPAPQPIPFSGTPRTRVLAALIALCRRRAARHGAGRRAAADHGSPSGRHGIRPSRWPRGRHEGRRVAPGWCEQG